MTGEVINAESEANGQHTELTITARRGAWLTDPNRVKAADFPADLVAAIHEWSRPGA